MLARVRGPQWLKVGIVAFAIAVIAIPAVTRAETPTEETFQGGSLTGLAIDAAFSHGSFQDLSFNYEACGSEPAELTCVWTVHALLFSNPKTRCVPNTPESQLLWDSGERSGNVRAESGPVDFALEGCRGQILNAYYEVQKTYNPDEQEGPWKILSSGGAGTLVSIVIGEELNKTNDPEFISHDPSSPLARSKHISLAVSANCRSLKVDGTRYSFAFRRMSCSKATRLARVAYLSESPPQGYTCKDKRASGERCWRRRHPEKYVEWHLPQGRSRHPA